MIKRERYMERIRPFIGNELIKVLTGLRRSGKSVMLQLIQDEILRMGASREQFVSIDFEQMDNAGLCTAEALHEELKRRISGIRGKAYLFLDEIQEVERWEKCVNSCRVDFDCDIYITGSNAKLLSGSWRLISPAAMSNLSSILSRSRSFSRCRGREIRDWELSKLFAVISSSEACLS